MFVNYPNAMMQSLTHIGKMQWKKRQMCNLVFWFDSKMKWRPICTYSKFNREFNEKNALNETKTMSKTKSSLSVIGITASERWNEIQTKLTFSGTCSRYVHRCCYNNHIIVLPMCFFFWFSSNDCLWYTRKVKKTTCHTKQSFDFFSYQCKCCWIRWIGAQMQWESKKAAYYI